MKKRSFKQEMGMFLGMNLIGFFGLAVIYWTGHYYLFNGGESTKIGWFLFLIFIFMGLQYLLFQKYVNKILAPLQDFYQVLNNIQSGNYEQMLQETNIVEIDRLVELINGMMRYFDGVIKNLKRIAAGDLDIQFHENGAINRSLETVVVNYKGLLNVVEAAIQQMNESVAATSSATQQLSSGISEQAGSANEMDASVEEMSQAAQNIANTADKLRESTDRVYGLIEVGRQTLESHRNAMELAKEITKENQRTVATLIENIQKIEGIFHRISDIATETKMLSLNASIEAIKAGEGGKGFSAVAVEIRKLTENILQFTNEVHSVVMVTKNSAHGVQTTSDKTENHIYQIYKQSAELDSQFERIDDETSEILKISQFVSEASNQQKIATLEMSKTIKDTSSVLKESAKSATSIANSMKQLRSFIDHYTNEVNSYFIKKGNINHEIVQN